MADNTSQHWTTEIRADHKFFDFRFSELVQYRDLIFLFVKRDLVVTYKQTVLGPVWVVLNPILTTFLFSLVFGRVVGISTEGIPIILFYMLGVVSWGFFSDCFLATAKTFHDNVDIFSKIYFPRTIVPLSIAISASIKLFIQLGVFTTMFGYYWMQGSVANVQVSVLLFIPLYILLACFGMGLGFIYASITSKYRDFLILLPIVVQFGMYLCPVVYPVSQIPADLRDFILWNPLSTVFEVLRFAWFNTGEFKLKSILYTVSCAVALMVLGTLMFNKTERKFLDTV